MENSDSDDEDSESAAHHGSWITQRLRLQGFYQFINHLSEDDYRLLRGNNLLGIPGESTEEELLRRLRELKGDPPPPPQSGECTEEELLRRLRELKGDPKPLQSEPGEDFSNEVSISHTTGNTESTIRSGPRVNQSWTTVSHTNPNSDDFRFSLRSSFNRIGNPHPEDDYAPSAKYSRVENMDNYGQRQRGNPLSEPTPSWLSRAKLSAMLTGEIPPELRVQGRLRSRNLEQQAPRVRVENGPPLSPMSEVSQRSHRITSSQTFQHPLINETEIFPRTQCNETLREPILGTELQSRGRFTTSGARDASQGETSPYMTSNEESWISRQKNPTRLLDLKVTVVYHEDYLQRDSTASGTPLTSETSSHTSSYEDERGGCRHTFSHSEQTGVSTIRFPTGITSDIGSSASASVRIPSTLRELLRCDESNYFIHNDSNSEPSDSAASQYIEHAESENTCHGNSDDFSHSSSNSNPNIDYSQINTSVPSLTASHHLRSSSSPIYISSPRDEIPEISSELFEGRNEGNASPRSSSEAGEEDQHEDSSLLDDSDLWNFPNLDLNEENQDQPIRLTEEQIDNLETRSFGKCDELNSCSICITEYTEGNKLRILPCSHEFHVHCIDRWLRENSTCPICHRPVLESEGR